MLDSNIVIAVALAAVEQVRWRMAEADAGDIVISMISYAEVFFGTHQDMPPRHDLLVNLVEEVPILPFDVAAAKAYAGMPFKRGGYDRLIAAHALSLDLVLVTNNQSDFADVPGLKVENWTI